VKKSVLFERTILPYLGITAKLAGFYIIDRFHEHEIDLSKEQWLILKKLHEKDGQTQNNLAFITNRSKTALTRLINTMEKKGLVYRVISKEDKRINHIHLSDIGKEIFLNSLPVLEKLITELQEGISMEELERTKKVLKQIQNNISKKLTAN